MYVRISYTLVSGYDIADFLQVLVDGCKEVFDVDVVGVLLEKRKGELALSTASDEKMRTLEAFDASLRIVYERVRRLGIDAATGPDEIEEALIDLACEANISRRPNWPTLRGRRPARQGRL